MASSNRFAAALEAHDPVRLRAAFEACNLADPRGGLHRTSLNRWLDGTVPQRGDFVQLLAAELDDPALYAAWQQARAGRGGATAESTIDSFHGLTAAEKDEAFHQIRGDYLSTFPSTRSRLHYRIEVAEPATVDDNDDHLMMYLTMTWLGAIPAQANVRFVTDQNDLGDAYEDATCIFREEVALEADRLHQLLASGPDQVLAINPQDSRDPTGVRHVGEQVEPGLFRFANDAAALAQVRLDLFHPHPRGRPVYFIRHGRYQVPDTVEVTLALRSPSTSSPATFPFMPPGRQREWATNLVRPNELFVSLGTGNTVLGEGDGAVLHWTESTSS